MNRYALDTNIISYSLRGDRQIQTRIYNEVNEGDNIVILPIVYYEIKRGLISCNAINKLKAFDNLCNIFGIDDLDIKILDIAADIYATRKLQGRSIEDADILIAASCLARNYTLVTNNEKHFEDIGGLRMVNWFK